MNVTNESQKVSKFKLMSAAQLLALPAPEWLVDGVLETRTLSVLYGPSKSCKSFAALDLAMCLATNTPWHGHAVKGGTVVYVIGEGTTGAAKRLKAWMQHHDVSEANEAFFLLTAPQLTDGNELADLTAQLADKKIKPTLIVLDTLARCFVGGDENSAQEIGRFVGACGHLQTATGAAVLIVHHTGKMTGKGKQPIERGSSALRAAADVMIAQTRTADLITLVNEKQKDDEEFKPVTLRLKSVEVGTADKPTTSCVLLTDNVSAFPAASSPLNTSEQLALDALVMLGSAASGKWLEAVAAAKGGTLPPKTFQNWRSALVEKGFVELVPDQPHTYRATEAGCAIAKMSQKHAA
jgi:hypothetical protein